MECLDAGHPAPRCRAHLQQAPYEKSAEYYDLKAQQEMAEWALVMLLVTSIGVVFVALTLKAAADANEGFKASAEADLRPYVFVAGVRSEKLTDAAGVKCVRLKIGMKNLGRTPAIVFWQKLTKAIRAAQDGPSWDDVGNDPQFAQRIALPPETTHFVDSDELVLNINVLRAISEQTLRVFFRVSLRYRGIDDTGPVYESFIPGEVLISARDVDVAWDSDAKLDSWFAFAPCAEGSHNT